MLPQWLSIISSVGMAVGPPLVYADQTVSIVRKKYVPPAWSQDYYSSFFGFQRLYWILERCLRCTVSTRP